MSELLWNMLNARAEFGKAKHEYINSIQEFLGDAATNIRVSFYGNKMYITFESWCPFDDKFLLKFCNEFEILAPIMEFKELSASMTLYSWKFIKILS